MRSKILVLFSHVNRIFNALKDDVFMLRIRQLAWESYCTRKGK